MTSRIQLNADEQQLKRLLLSVASHIRHNPRQDQHVGGDDITDTSTVEPLVLRWAGGWVRDKLLARDSQDIDVAINCMTGEAFVLRLREYCQDAAVLFQHGIGPRDIGNLHKIARNPDKSKHLETTTVKLFGLDVDFVNLRKETYAADSRNPQVEFGTAEEDALRRDATVNALFYNLHTDEVEDFVGGLPDMGRRLLRTPLAPLQTFMDDPLRVLRLVRFASRLDFSIDPDAEAVMTDVRVIEALKLKISRERVGIELEKMLKGKRPVDSLKLIDRLGLYYSIFTDPTDPNIEAPSTDNWHKAYGVVDDLIRSKEESGSIAGLLITSAEHKYYAWVLAAMAPWISVKDAPPPPPPPSSPSSSKGKSKPPPSPKPKAPLAATVAREGFKAPTRLCEVIVATVRHYAAIMDLFHAVLAKDDAVMGHRDRIGMAIRSWDKLGGGGHWKMQVLYAFVIDAMNAEAGTDVRPAWEGFLRHLDALDLMDAPAIPCLLNGRTLCQALGLDIKKSGKWMSAALDTVMAWQLSHPGEMDPTGAVEEVRRNKEKLGIPD